MQTVVEVESAPQLEELCRDATHVSCAYGNIVIFYSTVEPDSHYCDLNASSVIAYAKRYPAGLGMLVLIAADEPPPGEASRRAIRHSYVAMKDAIDAGVLVVEGEGFAASAKRSVITLINTTTSLPFPMRVAGNVADGAAKLVRMLGPKLAPGLNVQLVAAAATEVKTRLL
ncbi:MAG TPA: hypothetical protein VFG30_08285 [Polyangiales bacterium]|nr:hypothetical protein [Polyangiales bacterium]